MASNRRYLPVTSARRGSEPDLTLGPGLGSVRNSKPRDFSEGSIWLQNGAFWPKMGYIGTSKHPWEWARKIRTRLGLATWLRNGVGFRVRDRRPPWQTGKKLRVPGRDLLPQKDVTINRVRCSFAVSWSVACRPGFVVPGQNFRVTCSQTSRCTSPAVTESRFRSVSDLWASRKGPRFTFLG